jgi:hypothetical protein
MKKLKERKKKKDYRMKTAKPNSKRRHEGERSNSC